MSTSRESLILFTILTASLVLSSQPDDSEKLSDLLSSPENDTPGDNSGSTKLNTCTTDDCNKIAQLFAETMDNKIDPCQDFYGYMCGRWDNSSIPPGYNHFNRMKYLQTIIDRNTKRMMHSPPTATDALPVQITKKHYQSCINAQYSDVLRTIISLFDAIGGWPMIKNIDDWNEDAQSWQEVDTYFANLTGGHTFFRIKIVSLAGEDGVPEVQLRFPYIRHAPLYGRNYSELQRAWFQDETIKGILASHTGAHVSDEQLQKDIVDLYNFTGLLLSVIDRIETPLRLMNMTTWIDHWESLVESKPDPKTVINWTETVQRYFDVYNITINNATQLKVYVDYYDGLLELLRATDKRTIVNFIYWEISHALSMEINDIFINPTGNNRTIPCMERSTIEKAVTYWFVNECIADYDRNVKDVRTLVTNIQKEMALQMNNSNYMSDSLKLNMQRRLDAVKYKIGAPDWTKNRSLFESDYQGLVIGDNYVINVINAVRFSRLYSYRDLQRWRSTDYWRQLPIEVGASYYYYRNEIYIPSGIIQLPFFSSDVPEYINYGGLGFIIGHEIGHGLDEAATREKSIHERYKRQFQCLSDLFREFYQSEEAISVKHSENIADAFGLSLAFSSYKRLKQNGEINVTLTIPEFEQFTDEQMFFMSFGQSLCKITTSDYVEDSEDDHSASKLRVNIGVSNSLEFATAFNCPVGSPMNPTKKCSAWKDNPTH